MNRPQSGAEGERIVIEGAYTKRKKMSIGARETGMKKPDESG
jgi:hypothetical protein